MGVFSPHTLDVFYLGLTGDGHIDKININHALYSALGTDSRNPLANQAQSISAFMGALELSYDRDYARFKASFFMRLAMATPTIVTPQDLIRSLIGKILRVVFSVGGVVTACPFLVSG